MTTNTIRAELKDVQTVAGYLALTDQDFIVSPKYTKDGIEFRDFVWFSEDGGELCAKIIKMVGGRFTNYRDGVEVA